MSIYKIYADRDYVDSKALPEGAAAYKQLVTDGEGVAKWEDRTHYSKTVDVEIFDIANQGYIDDFWYFESLGVYTVEMSDPILSQPIEGGKQYKVVWDGTEYTCISFAIGSNVALGNMGFTGSVEAADYPFGVELANDGWLRFFTEQSDPKHDIKIFAIEEIIKTLDPKYLPDNIGGGIKTAIIKSSDYDNALAGVSIAAALPEPEITYSCINMTFAEAWETLMKGEPLHIQVLYAKNENIMQRFGGNVVIDVANSRIICLIGDGYEWTADGFVVSE